MCCTIGRGAVAVQVLGRASVAVLNELSLES